MELPSEELQVIADRDVSEGTKRTELWATSNYQVWAEKNSQPTSLEALLQLGKEDAGAVLEKWILTTRKKSGEPYDCDSIRILYFSLARAISRIDDSWDLVKDKEFKRFAAIKNVTVRETRTKQQKTSPKQAKALSVAEEDKLFAHDALQASHASGLNYRLFVVLAIAWGVRGGCWYYIKNSAIQIERDESTNKQYLTYNPIADKSHKAVWSNDTAKTLRAVEHSDASRCPIALWKKMNNRRPEEAKDLLFLKPLQQPKQNIWYTRECVGKRLLDSWMSTICSLVDIEVRTNHFGRCTKCKRLVEHTRDLSTVQQITGHKRVSSLFPYTEPEGQRLVDLCEAVQEPVKKKTKQTYSCTVDRTLPDGTEETLSFHNLLRKKRRLHLYLLLLFRA